MEESSAYFEVPIFTSAELEEATNNFSASNELGDGGFGSVYYGEKMENFKMSGSSSEAPIWRNYRRVKQFMNEVEILTRLLHKNLVSLDSCTFAAAVSFLLVYEYISNGTVADHIHGQRANSSTTLPWKIRMDIAIETATALAYLHASDIVHRDEMKPPMDEVLEELKAIACNDNAVDIFVDADKGEGVLAPSPPDYDDSQLLK
ncbi:hypothetical protein NL676_032062 [Syzygium grande]|nr:hypothetical protein NL676_032062 [Syzygium grande]